jgi:ABC-type dipeptide/oligopeptide/nickel transport system permease subunit
MHAFYNHFLLWIVIFTIILIFIIPVSSTKEVNQKNDFNYWTHSPTFKSGFLFGTYNGYNMLYIICIATKTTLKISILGLGISLIGGMLLIFFYYYSRFKNILDIIHKVITYFPRLFFLIFFSYIFKLQETSQLLCNVNYYLVVMFGITGSLFLLSQTYSEIKLLENQLFIHFSRSVGCSELWIFCNHVLKNCPLLPISIIKQMRDNILFLSILTFIGCVNLQPEDLGSLICRLANDPAIYQKGWWILFFPCFFLTWIILLLNLCSEKIANNKL